VERVEPPPDGRHVRDRIGHLGGRLAGVSGELDPGLRRREQLRGVGNGGFDRLPGDDLPFGDRLQSVADDTGIGFVECFGHVGDGEVVGLRGFHITPSDRLPRSS